MTESESVFTTSDGTQLRVYTWTPTGAPRAVVQLVHGASEHAGRYRRFANLLTDAGYAVFAHDQRGHGRSATEFGTLGVARPGGWNAMVADVHELTDWAKATWPGVPLVLMGHSMGASVVQNYLPSWGGELDAAVLSGPPAPITDAGLVEMLEAVAAGDAADQPSEIFAQVFAGFNQSFADAAPDGAVITGFEWLSRDTAEVQAYVDDPLCGADAPLTNGFVADMVVQGINAATPERLALIPEHLPMLVVVGELDPAAGGGDGARALVDGYRALGLDHVDLVVYEGGHHEVLNETNRDQVQADILAWLARTLG